jgi:hypothetical protein
VAYRGGFINLVSGKSSSLPVDPTVWQRIVEQNQRAHERKKSLRIKTAKVSVVG